MHWIDITLPGPGINQPMDDHLSAAVAHMARIPELQTRDGLDAVGLVDVCAEVGRLLFKAVQAVDPEAFAPDRAPAAAPVAPSLGDPAHDTLRGYLITADPEHVGLPWHWLHNGVAFLYTKYPECTAIAAEAQQRPWMQRQQRAAFLLADDGSHSMRGVLPQLRPAEAALPRLLFIPGHTDRQLRRLIYREAEAIQGALKLGCHGQILAHLEVEPDPITPSDLCQRGLMYQAIHFAGPTSLPATLDDKRGEYWMNQLIEETSQPADEDIEAQVGLEGEVLGVDPITSLLDDVTAHYELNGPPVEIKAGARQHNGPPATPTPPARPTWLLDDGPVAPEHLGREGWIPPLIFSNSFCALPEMGSRFLQAGASTFIGPVMPLFSRPARIYAGYFYQALGQGWSAGSAAWKAAQSCRKEFGDEHPVWLSYGVQGQVSLALPYL